MPIAPLPQYRSATASADQPAAALEHREDRLAREVRRRAARARGAWPVSARPRAAPATTRTRPGVRDPASGLEQARGLVVVDEDAAAPRRASAWSASSGSRPERLGDGARRGRAGRASRARRAEAQVGAARAGARRAACPRRAARGRPRPGRSRRSTRPARLEARRAVGARRLAEQVAPAGASPRPTRPRSWWSWARPKRHASSIDHHGRVGHVDADLDDDRGDEHVERRRRGTGPSPTPCRPPASGRAAGRRAARPARPRASRSRSATAPAASTRLGPLDERADDVGAVPGGHLARAPRAARLGLLESPVAQRRGDRRAPRGQLVEHRQVEVAEEDHRRGARDRRGGHDQQVGVGGLGRVRRGPCRAARRAARPRSGAARR